MARRSRTFPRLIAALSFLAGQLVLLAGAAPQEAPLAAPATPPPPAEILVARAYFKNDADLSYLVSRYDATEHADHQAGFVELLLTPGEYAGLQAAGYRVEIDQAHTDLLNRPQAALPAQTGGVPSYPCYRTVEETYAAMAQLAADYPALATWIDIGDSWEKTLVGGAPGYDLRVLILTNAAVAGPKPVFFLMAAIHAREYTTAETAARYAEHLAANYGVDPNITWLLDHFEVHILPQANPDGRKLAEAGHYHRKNTNATHGAVCPTPYISYHRGIDLNRNSSFQWGGVGGSSEPCSQLFRGPAAASEPETEAIESYAASIFPDQRGPALTDPAPADASGVFITLHSYSELVLFPWGASAEASPNHAALQTLGRKFGYFNRYAVCQSGAASCLYQTSGTTDDWAYGELGVAAYTFELGDFFFEACSSFEATIWPANRAALLYAHKAARRPYQAPAGPETLTMTVSSTLIVAGTPLTLTVFADDRRYDAGPGGGSEPTQPIAAARFSLDAPAWVTGTATLPLAAVDGAFDASLESARVVLDTTGWPAGRRLLFVESQDSAGNWGVPGAVFVSVAAEAWQLHYLPAVWR